MEHYLEAKDDKSIGTVKEVIQAIIDHFPGSIQEGSRMVAVREDNEYIADVSAHGPSSEDDGDDEEDLNDLENPDIQNAPVTWFNILGDNELDVVEFLCEKYGVESQPM